MASVEQTSETGSHSPPSFQPQDARQLAGLLANLLPMLISLHPTAADMARQIDQQASVAMVKDLIADSVARLSGYLDHQTARQPGLETCSSQVAQAEQCAARGDVETAFSLIWQTYRGITALRMADPTLPPVGEGEFDAAAAKSAAIAKGTQQTAGQSNKPASSTPAPKPH
jgi:hypothetical protein